MAMARSQHFFQRERCCGLRIAMLVLIVPAPLLRLSPPTIPRRCEMSLQLLSCCSWNHQLQIICSGRMQISKINRCMGQYFYLGFASTKKGGF